ncbi:MULTISPECIES: hypothetical protein [Nonomuraea]|uniref:Uncharacterized protein n=2 Tax=Nonomuraea TaxID=83681 RepID=A0ABW1BUP4_9ACTN|nr:MULTISPECIES: hypothetical protein [Nonomuraea]MDA0646631.1 hypothetical protein [Nonomuraea ferruginea]TXK42683.1 hypothetical protein FR742_26680 [Nonomuraea sp. C10]
MRALAHMKEILSKEPRLPDGFSPRSEQAWRAPFTPADRNCRAVLDAAGGRAPERGLTAQAAASYQGDELGEQVGVGLARYAGAADEHMAALAGSLRACREVRAKGGTHLTATLVPVADVGDEAVSGELRGRLNGYPYALDVVLARSGDMLVSLVHTSMAEVEPQRTRQLLDAVMRMASP